MIEPRPPVQGEKLRKKLGAYDTSADSRAVGTASEEPNNSEGMVTMMGVPATNDSSI